MRPDRRVRAGVVIDRRGEQTWHRAVTDAMRLVDGADVSVIAFDGALPALAGRRFDVVIDLANVECGVDLPFGVWRYSFGDGAPVAEGAAGTIARLCRMTPDPDRVIVLHEGWFRARTAHGRGTASVPTRVAPWCARVLRQIAMGDAAVVQRAACSTAGCTLARPPRHAEPIGGPIGDTLRSWSTRARWTVGLLPFGVEEIMQRGRLPTPAWIRGQPADRFYADPFLLSVEGDIAQLCVEDYRYWSRAKGLSELCVRMDGTLLDSRTRCDLPSRASYPFLLRHQGRIFCIPETHSARGVSASVRDGASGAWTPYRDLMTGFPFVDSTLLDHAGTWWLFCTKQGDEDQTDLHVFHADAWEGPWTPHALNPVKSDTRSSRPAGACFTIDGVVYRPAQNCARRYGAGLTINRLVELSPSRFREEAVLSLGPPPGPAWPDGVHTINSLGGVTVIDALRVERRWRPAAWA